MKKCYAFFVVSIWLLPEVSVPRSLKVSELWTLHPGTKAVQWYYRQMAKSGTCWEIVYWEVRILREEIENQAVKNEGVWITVEKCKELLAVDFEDVELGNLTDISKVRIDRNQPVEKRRQRYLEKAVNPYLVRVGNIKVKIRFADNGVSLEDAFENLLLTV